MDEKYFYSIEGQRRTTIKIKRSIFICTMEYVDSIGSAKTFISRISKENKTASHNCWAYISGEKGENFHSSDAGEPPGTAGKPMLNRLKAYNMTDVAAVVTRHFGGIRLGVRGLIEAYSLSVQKTIELKKLKKLIHTLKLKIEVSYGFNDTLLNLLDSYLVQIKNTDYTDKIAHTIEIEQKKFNGMEKRLLELQSRGKLKFTMICKGKRC